MAAPAENIDATTLEGQVLETIRELQQAEDAWVAAGQTLDPPVNRQRRLSLSVNFNTKLATVSMTIPVTFDDSANGMEIDAVEYITGV